MIVSLDHAIFGNGYGLGSPYFDGQFFWLSGELYHWIGGFGAQLSSFQWRHPIAGERRKMLNREFEPLHSRRYFLWLWRDRWFAVPTPICRVVVSWQVVRPPKNIDDLNAYLRQMRKELTEL